MFASEVRAFSLLADESRQGLIILYQMAKSLAILGARSCPFPTSITTDFDFDKKEPATGY